MRVAARSVAAGFMALLARAIIRKYRPKIVMVTGSVGKTSTKDACAAALSEHFYLRASEKSYNSEFGVPLTIIGAENPWAHPFKWLQVIEEALALIFLTADYPELLVLEVGADRPGDLRQILKIATPDAVVVTRLPEVPVHVEAYPTPHAVREEEFTPAYALTDGAPLVICADDPHAHALAAPLRARIHTYGLAKEANVRFESVRVYEEHGEPAGMEADVVFNGEEALLRARGCLGRQQLYAPAAALALSSALGISSADALRGLESYVPPPGRARLLRGIAGTTVIDDSYNASPAAAEEILHSLALIPGKHRRIAVLGDMLELGRYSVDEHRRVGVLAAKLADVVVGVGVRARAITEAARESGKGEGAALHFDTSLAAAEGLPPLLKKKDLILIKGSQSMRMEKLTAALLADTEDRGKLVRQDPEWLRR